MTLYGKRSKSEG